MISLSVAYKMDYKAFNLSYRYYLPVYLTLLVDYYRLYSFLFLKY